ncbi:MAG: hypothetical protein Fur0025_01980 [Oscillatoriaceae cyanobacterium]
MIQPGLLLQNRYLVIQKLGEGGFGTTFAVSDTGTPKVLKVLLNNYPKAVSLFQREAEVLQRLDHPGIPKVEPDGYFTFEPGDNAEPLHCLVMEKIEGQNLQEWLLENQPISQKQAIDWLKQLAQILHQVHEQQYFHRDIKPSNIMLKPDGQLVLIDFGAVRELTETYWRKVAQKDVTGMISAGYTPPEQYDGKAEIRSDFFALGRTFVHLMTGKHPIDVSRDSETGALIWRESAKQVSESLADLIDCLMAPFPGQRPENALVILQRLESLVGNTALVTPSELVKIHWQNSSTSQLRRRQFIRKNLKWAALLLLWIGSTLWMASPQIAVVLNEKGAQHYSENEYNVAEWYFRGALILQPGMGTARYNLGAACNKQNKYDCVRSQHLITAKDGDDNAASLALNDLGRLSIMIDKDYDAALKWLWQGLERAKSAEVQSDLHKNIGWVYWSKGDAAKAEPELEKAIELNRENVAAHCLLAQVRSSLGNRAGPLVEWKNCLIVAPGDRRPEVADWREQARQQLEQEIAGEFESPTP